MAKRISKKRKKFGYLIFIFLVVLPIVAYWGYNWWNYRRAKFTHYAEFGISIPENFLIHGIDVSRYQQTIASEEVEAMQVQKIKIGFAFIKATEGIGNTDEQFSRNWKKCKQAGIPRGAYHFFLATKDGKEQAENFIKNVELSKGDLPPVVDIEQNYGVNAFILKKELQEWLDVTENYYKVKPIIYTNVDFYNKYLNKDFDGYPLWAAHYFQYDAPRINRGWAFWQHGEGGRVNGILTKVDFNVFNGDSTEFRQLLIE